MCDKHRITSCQYIGKDQDPYKHWPIKYCGAPVVEGRSYCEDHLWVVYQKGTNTPLLSKKEQAELLADRLEAA